MAVAHDAVSESHTGTTGAANVASFTWNHAGGASARSALVFTVAIGANPVSGVTYGGVDMTAVPYTAYATDAEPGFVQAWFLDNCGTGTKAVVVSRTNNAVVTYATCMTQTAAAACEVYLAGVKTQAGSASAQTAASSSSAGTCVNWTGLALDDGSPGTNSIRYLAVYSGFFNGHSAGTDTTANGASSSIDFGNYTFGTFRETTPSQGVKTIRVSTPWTDDLAAIGLAIREVSSVSVSSDLGASWSLASLVSDDLGASWTIASKVSADRSISWSIASSVDTDCSLSWSIQNEVGSNSAISWAIASDVANDLALEWSIGIDQAPVFTSLSPSWTIGGIVDQDLMASWTISNLVDQDLGGSWAICNLVDQDLGLSWVIRNLADQDLAASWSVRNLIISNQNPRWAIDSVVFNGLPMLWRIDMVYSDLGVR